MKPAILIWANSAQGVYIPQYFAESADRAAVSGVSDEDWRILESGPDTEWYWETWDAVEQNAEIRDGEHVYRLYQDGDLFAVCDALMSDEQYLEFYGEPRE